MTPLRLSAIKRMLSTLFDGKYRDRGLKEQQPAVRAPVQHLICLILLNNNDRVRLDFRNESCTARSHNVGRLTRWFRHFVHIPGSTTRPTVPGILFISMHSSSYLAFECCIRNTIDSLNRSCPLHSRSVDKIASAHHFHIRLLGGSPILSLEPVRSPDWSFTLSSSCFLSQDRH